MSEHILYVGMQHDYGDPARGLSYEHRNFHASLEQYCKDRSWKFDFFDFMAFGKEHGLDALSEELLRRCGQLRPTVLITVLYHFDFDPHYEVFQEISRTLGTVTCNWFCDDQWRFESYSSVVAPHFDYICTTSRTALPKYAAAGIADRVIKSQWACNTTLYRPTATAPEIDVSFIGQPHGNRPELVGRMVDAGIPVEVFGFGWPGRPRVPFHQMVRLFSLSRINLNLSKASIDQEEQIKGRNFEIPGAGGFQISFNADNLGEYYQDGKEIVLVQSIDEMIDKTRYFLKHESERQAIARAGYERTLREHTWQHRFDEIFRRIGTSKSSPTTTVSHDHDLQFKNQRIDELLRVNRELWESRTFFLEKITYLEEELGKRDGRVREMSDSLTLAKEGLEESQKQIDGLRAELEQQKAATELVQQEKDQSQNISHQLRHQVATLENTIRGLTALKIFRLREAIKVDPPGIKKVIRICYLVVGMGVPGAIRGRMSPLTISMKRRLGLLPHEVVVPTPKTIEVRQKPWSSDRPLLSVIVPSYNYGRFIKTALDSILKQTFQNFEVLIIDCSSDQETIDILKAIDHPKIKVIFREGRHFLGDNRNFGINLARGKYVTCLDPDDILKPTYYEKAVYILEQGFFDIVSTSVQEFEQGSVRWLLHVRPELSQLLNMNLISVVAVYSREVWSKSRGFHDYGMGAEHVHEDWDFWIRSMALGARVMNIREPLMWYRIHGNNMSKAKNLPSLEEQKHQIRTFNKKILTDQSVQQSSMTNRNRYVVRDGLINLESAAEQTQDTKTVLFALPYAVIGGAHKRFLELGNFLKQQGYRIVVVTTIETTDDQVNLLADYESITSDIFPLPEVLSDQLDWREFICYLIRSRGIGTVLLGGSQYFYDHLSFLKMTFPGLKVVDQQFNLSVHFNNNRSNCSAIDFTIVENETIAGRLHELDPEGHVKFELIQNGVDTRGEFSPSTLPVARPAEIPEGKIVVSFIGRMSHEKGPDLFLEIVEQCAQQSDLFFILAGPGPMLEGLREALICRGLSEKVWTPGSINTREFLEYTDILLLPSRIDGRPNIVLEALSLGVPIVAADVGGIPYLIQEGETGFICPIGATDKFVEKTAQLARDSQLRASMSKAARDFALHNLDSSLFLPKYLDVFNSLEEQADIRLSASAR